MSRYVFSGSRFKERRLRAGMQLELVALAVGRTTRTVSRYEVDAVEPSPEMVVQLARVVGATPGDLYVADESEQVSA